MLNKNKMGMYYYEFTEGYGNDVTKAHNTFPFLMQQFIGFNLPIMYGKVHRGV